MKRRELIGLLGSVAIAWPLAGRAQDKATPVIGVLGSGRSDAQSLALAGFRQGLSEAGFVEATNLAIEYRWAEGHNERLPALAADLVNRGVAVIVAFSPPAARAAKDATSTIPTVFNTGDDPVATGLVASLARPGGNRTGVSILLTELVPKRFELLREMVPQAQTIALLVNPNGPEAEPSIRAAQAAAQATRIQLATVKASDESEIDAAFVALVQQHADALLVGADPVFFGWHEKLVALTARYAVPASYFFREFTAVGGLMSYGPNFFSVYRQIGIYTGRILKGERPADLPVQQPTKFELVVNLKTAKALGLTMHQSILARADEVIE